MQAGQSADLLLAQLIDIGYGYEAASAAITATHSADLQQTVQWLLDNPNAGQDTDWMPVDRAFDSAFESATAHGQGSKHFFSPLASGVVHAQGAEGAKHSAAFPGFQSGEHDEAWSHYDNPATLHQGPATGAWRAAGHAEPQAAPQLQSQQHHSAYVPPPQQPNQAVQHKQQQQQQQLPRGYQPQQQQQQLGSPAQRSAAHSGVAGLIAREQQKAASADRVLDTALHDLQALMTQAQAMVDLAEQFRLQLARQPPEPGSQEVMAIDLTDDLFSMGIAAPVTKETAGRKYHKQLAQQLAEFLRAPLERAGGMMTLPDVYCLFNRARGTELVSPDDLVQAVKHLGKVGARLELREFADGVRVLQSLSHSNEEVCARVVELVQGEGLGPALSAHSAAAALHVPLAIAQAHLATAEGAGMLCRDDGPEGLRYFRNFFAEANALEI